MNNLDKVKNDLRSMRKNAHVINGLYNLQKTYEKRISLLEKLERGERVRQAILREKQSLDEVDVLGYIKESRDLEAKYQRAINSLDPVDKTIIIESFINGVAYWKIGNQLGFTSEGIRKRIQRALTKIARMV
ncbi:MAG: sigma-70 family RNA polymerase sigma factor [Clostridia bacterium]|nr:sigma-70 family RNA polymerase sigma factor [Clostridia bacterium]